jgi:hypothetical protein
MNDTYPIVCPADITVSNICQGIYVNEDILCEESVKNVTSF